jgi:hypothetical protein
MSMSSIVSAGEDAVEVDDGELSPSAAMRKRWIGDVARADLAPGGDASARRISDKPPGRGC